MIFSIVLLSLDMMYLQIILTLTLTLVLLSLDMMYLQIISHCIDHEIMDFDSETPLWSSVCDVMLWILCFDLG